MSEIETLTTSALAEIAAAATLEALDAQRVALLGKSGSITGQLKQLGALPPDQRKAAGLGEVRACRDRAAEQGRDHREDAHGIARRARG